MATLALIEEMTKEYAAAREKLADTVRTLTANVEKVKRQYMPVIKRQLGVAAARKLDLKNVLEDSKDLFVKPRTVIFHGIKVGFQKGKGKIEWDSDEQVLRLIEKYFPDMADVLIRTRKKPVKKALAALSVAELKRLGIAVEDTGDTVVIEATDSEIEKLVETLLKEKDEEDNEDAA